MADLGTYFANDCRGTRLPSLRPGIDGCRALSGDDARSWAEVISAELPSALINHEQLCAGLQPLGFL